MLVKRVKPRKPRRKVAQKRVLGRPAAGGTKLVQRIGSPESQPRPVQTVQPVQRELTPVTAARKKAKKRVLGKIKIGRKNPGRPYGEGREVKLVQRQ